MSTETYTIFLYRNDIAVPIETNVINKTSIKAPRITVIQQLLASRPEGFFNPFPVDCSFERVSFNRDVCLVTLSSKMETEAEERERMKLLLVYTMKAYGLSEVQIYWAESHKKSDS
ncbi:hypothetical protein C2I18_07585 [Paenibacillus sp. PK3_47]|uniref:GerMN domain-containing protein n=1 Tax=Paenibacillus sp. PK3_47 TaxID=2072642 RepID=UPI00201E131D|nr:GerMN domain-containing protein [Paenibacillus sp. PK3_47]UQZ33430.1 hypothetical protein C2I18_07585 [Paenibacillus sp. PK3_47]